MRSATVFLVSHYAGLSASVSPPALELVDIRTYYEVTAQRQQGRIAGVQERPDGPSLTPNLPAPNAFALVSERPTEYAEGI